MSVFGFVATSGVGQFASITLPVGAQPGDMCWVTAMVNVSGAPIQQGGWDVQQHEDIALLAGRFTTYRKVLPDPLPAAIEFDWTGEKTWTAVSYAGRGYDPVTPVEVVGSQAGGSSPAFHNGITPTIDNCVVVFAAGVRGATTFDTPAGFIEQIDYNPVGWNYSTALSLVVQGAAQPTGVVSAPYYTARSWATQLNAIRPAGAGYTYYHWEQNDAILRAFAWAVDDVPNYRYGGPMTGYKVDLYVPVAEGGNQAANTYRVVVTAWDGTAVDDYSAVLLARPTIIVWPCTYLPTAETNPSQPPEVLDPWLAVAPTLEAIAGKLKQIEAKLDTNMGYLINVNQFTAVTIPEAVGDVADSVGLLAQPADPTVHDKLDALDTDVSNLPTREQWAPAVGLQLLGAVGAILATTGSTVATSTVAGLAAAVPWIGDMALAVVSFIDWLDDYWQDGTGLTAEERAILDNLQSLLTTADITQFGGLFGGTFGQAAEPVSDPFATMVNKALAAMSNYHASGAATFAVAAGVVGDYEWAIDQNADAVRVTLTGIPTWAGKRVSTPELYEVNRRAEQLGWAYWRAADGQTAFERVVWADQLFVSPRDRVWGAFGLHLMSGVVASVQRVEFTYTPVL